MFVCIRLKGWCVVLILGPNKLPVLQDLYSAFLYFEFCRHIRITMRLFVQLRLTHPIPDIERGGRMGCAISSMSFRVSNPRHSPPLINLPY